MRIRLTVFIVGLSSVIAQTIIIREGLILFDGYELASGIVLCLWLVWAGIGSLIFSVLRPKGNGRNTISMLLFLQCIFVLYAFLFLRSSYHLFKLPYGEVISLGNMLLITGFGMIPLCMVFGALFPAMARMLEPNHVYLFEGLGACIGGILITFVLIRVMPPAGVIVLIITLLLACAFMVRHNHVCAVLSFIVLGLFIKVQDIELLLRQLQMPGQQIVAVDESRYGLIAITQSQEQVNFYTSGVYSFSYPDPYSIEEAVHYPLLLHPDPEHVLLIGGGVGGSVRQILKHPSVKLLTYVELDPLLYVMGSRYIDEDENFGSRAQIVFGDARHYVKTTNVEYDVVIVNLPDPVNAQLNRFYTSDFFADANRVLQHGGILSLRLTAPPNILGALHAELFHTIKASLAVVYRDVLVLPASQMTYIATNVALDVENIPEQLQSRIETRNLDLQYVNRYFFDYELSNEKIAYVEEQMENAEATLNTDLKPVCYYYTMVLWGGVISESLRNVFVKLFHISPWIFFIPLIIVFPFCRRKSIVYISVIAVGASEISAEILLIILFQVLYGYLYGWIGGIIASYMFGLAIGTLLYLKTRFFRGDPVEVLSNVELGMGLYFLCIIAVSLLPLPGVNILIPALIFLGGVIGGLHFPLSIAIVSRKRAGIVYGVDMIGSAFGALLTAIILIPIIGIPFTLLFFLALNVLVGIGLRTVPKR
jgi:spermidine synthase